MVCMCGLLSVFIAMVLSVQIGHVTAQRTNETDDCPMGASLDMDKEKLLATLFPGLFVNRKELRPKLMKKNLATIVKSVRRRKLNTVAFANEETCCEMITEVIKPVTVQHEETTYNVVHLTSEEQLVTMTSCVNVQNECGTSGKCAHRTGYDWILVWDFTLAYYPPVKFIPMTINVGCECR